MKQIKLNISLTRAIAVCACIAALFTVIGMLIGSAAAVSDKPCITQTDPAPVYLCEPDIRIEDTYNYMEFTATAYCKCCECNGKWGTDDPFGQAVSATGARLTEGVSIAADFTVLPPFTQIEISGMGIYTVHDCGCAIKGNRIDVYFDNHADAEAFGVQKVYVRILSEDD